MSPTIFFRGRKQYDKRTWIELYERDGRYFFRFRDKKTGRFVRTRPIWRLTLVIRTIPIHRRYFSTIAQAFGSKTVLEENEDEIRNRLIEFTEEVVGYSEEDWWFVASVERELVIYPTALDEAKEVFEYINKCELREEDEYGVEITSETFELQVI